VETSSDGTFRDWPGAVILKGRRANPTGDRAWLGALCDALEARGPRPISRATAEALAVRTGQSVAEAAYLLAVFPNELDKEARERLGLKAVEANVAAEQLSGTGVEAKLEVLSAAAPADPLAFWSDDPEDPEGQVARLGAAWVARFGRGVPVAPELLAAAANQLDRRHSALIKPIAQLRAGSWPALEADVVWQVNEWGRVAAKPDDADVDGRPANEGLSGDQAAELGATLAWLAGKVPVGDPLLANHAKIHELLVARLRNPTLLLSAGEWYAGDSDGPARSFFDALGGERTELRRDGDAEPIGWQRRVGPLVANLGSWKLELQFRPADIDPTSRELIEAFRGAASSDPELRIWELLQGEDYAALIRRAVDSPLPPGSWEQDPTKSAPEVVAAVAKAHGLSQAGAALYLQTLTLLEPTKKSVCTWNGWTTKAYAAAAAELVGKGLVLEAKRARAGREHFLPGPWVEMRDVLPYEEWKEPLYGKEPGGYEPFPRLLPLAPLHTLFERAWARCRAEPPKFEEVRR
jgi:hypothetical protein